MSENIKQNTTTVETVSTSPAETSKEQSNSVKTSGTTVPAAENQNRASVPTSSLSLSTSPATQATTAESTPSKTATGQGIQNALTGASLPEGYLADGSMVDADGVMRAEYTGTYAEELAKKLKPLPASTFYSTFLREAKALRKKKTPYGAQKNCALGMVTQAKKLRHRSKNPAPGVLVEIITAATATVTDPATFEALYMHLDAIYSYMLE